MDILTSLADGSLFTLIGKYENIVLFVSVILPLISSIATVYIGLQARKLYCLQRNENIRLMIDNLASKLDSDFELYKKAESYLVATNQINKSLEDYEDFIFKLIGDKYKLEENSKIDKSLKFSILQYIIKGALFKIKEDITFSGKEPRVKS
jgi:hypothetical protein